MASKTPLAYRAGSAPPVLEKNRRPELDFMKSKECKSVVLKAAEDEWNSMFEVEKGPYERKALETSAALSRAAESYKMMMNARKETLTAAPPTEEKLS